MKTEDKKAVSDILSEKPLWIRIGLLPLRIKPVTLSQIYEMGAIANDIDSKDIEGKEKFYVLAETLKHYNDARLMTDIFMVCAFRSRLVRKLLGWYVRHNLTLMHFQELMTYLTRSLNINFFLTSIISLRRTSLMTEPSLTTAHGQQSGE